MNLQIGTQAVSSHATTGDDMTAGTMQPHGDPNNGDGNILDEDDLEESRSQTSTLRYEHEPFGTIQHKIVKIMAMHLSCDFSDVRIERMKGGTYNRIFGVQVQSMKPSRSCLNWTRCFRPDRLTTSTQSYIVRVPRRGVNNVEQQIATLKTIISKLSLPTPEVVAYNTTPNNDICTPYMIQKRLPGQRITDLLDELNEDQMISLTKRVTELVSQIASIHASPSRISPDNSKSQGDSQVVIDKLQVPGGQVVASVAQRPIDHLLERCQQWSNYENEQKEPGLRDIWNRFAAIFKSLEARGFLDGPCVLVHGDLREYNLLAEVRSSTEVEITGIIDWDDAFFAPEFVAYRAPFWLWTLNGMKAKNTEENDALIEPTTAIDLGAKHAFMCTASDEYRLFAFSQEAILARRMYTILQAGIFGDVTFAEANNIIKEWVQLHPEDNITAKIYSVDDRPGPD